jgi:AraC-like DNA-binding protein
VLLHQAFEGHLDRVETGGAEVLVLELPPALAKMGAAIGLVNDPDSLARLAEKNLHDAGELLATTFVAQSPEILDWPDLLAEMLRKESAISLSQWAEEEGLRPETLSRGFRSAYGCTPRAYRANARARSALRAIRANDTSLASIAQDLQFADQSHMTRAVVALSGTSPGVWRQTSS